MGMIKKIFLITSLIFLFCCKKQEKILPFGSLQVDKDKKEIIFFTEINPECKEPYFLFYFDGYPWIKNISFFLSKEKLKSLQTAVAYIDWKLWDSIYTKPLSVDTKNIEVYIEINGEWVDIRNYVEIKDIRNIVFWGSPVYDIVVLGTDYGGFNPCNTCKFLPMEQNLFLQGIEPVKIKSLHFKPQELYKVKFVFTE